MCIWFFFFEKGGGSWINRENHTQLGNVHCCEEMSKGQSVSLTLFAGSLDLACVEDVLKYAQRVFVSPLPLPLPLPPVEVLEAIAIAVAISSFVKAASASGSALCESARVGDEAGRAGETTPDQGRQAAAHETMSNAGWHSNNIFIFIFIFFFSFLFFSFLFFSFEIQEI